MSKKDADMERRSEQFRARYLQGMNRSSRDIRIKRADQQSVSFYHGDGIRDTTGIKYASIVLIDSDGKRAEARLSEEELRAIITDAGFILSQIEAACRKGS